MSFKIHVPDTDIDELHRRIDNTRWPSAIEGFGWGYGIPIRILRELVEHWRNHFDWRSAERRINAFTQYIVELDGLPIHMIHQRSPHAGAIPLLLTHGWPGSIVEFLDVIPRLTEPERFGGSAKDAVHVVAPSLPGFGYSGAPRESGMSPRRIAERHLKLMDELGYHRFVAQGGDWGALISRYLPDLAPERIIGLHSNFVAPRPPHGELDPFALCAPAERDRLERDRADADAVHGYSHLQRTKPNTLAYGLTDSPVGLAAWIGEKFHGWTDNEGDIRDAVSFDSLLTNISLYWFTNTIASSVRTYREYDIADHAGDRPLPRCEVPFGAALYKRELVRPPRAWVEHEYNVVHWFEADRGGHFAAMEQPALFVEDLTQFLRRVR